MPKETIRDWINDSMQLDVTWSGREGANEVQVGTRMCTPSTDEGPQNLQELTASWEQPEGMYGLFVTLDQVALNALIRVLKRAGKAAYGINEW